MKKRHKRVFTKEERIELEKMFNEKNYRGNFADIARDFNRPWISIYQEYKKGLVEVDGKYVYSVEKAHINYNPHKKQNKCVWDSEEERRNLYEDFGRLLVEEKISALDARNKLMFKYKNIPSIRALYFDLYKDIVKVGDKKVVRVSRGIYEYK